jgi:hypothetical protein
MILGDIAHCRAGDKGDISNLCIVAHDPADYPAIARTVTADALKAFLGARVRGPVIRYELPQLQALNFVLHDALGGGVTRSLSIDAHGKCLSGLVLQLPVDCVQS